MAEDFDLVKALREAAQAKDYLGIEMGAPAWLASEAADAIESLQEQIAQLNDGRRAVIPQTRKHAEDLYTVAEAALRSFREGKL